MLHEQRRPYVLSDDFSRYLALLRLKCTEVASLRAA